MSNKDDVPGKVFTEKVKFAATLIGLLSPIIALATFVGLKPEKQKRLELEYLSKSSLINTEAPKTEKIGISYEGRQISQLTVVVARLSNTGSLPVDSADIKDNAFPALSFPNSVKVVGAEIKERIPGDLLVKVEVDTNSVKILPGLMNPLDSVTVQILLEGEIEKINQLPLVSFRIADIARPITTYPQPKTQQTGIAYFNFSTATQFFLLICASLLPAFMLGFSLFGAHNLWEEAFKVFEPTFSYLSFEQGLRKLATTINSKDDLKKSIEELIRKAVKVPHYRNAQEIFAKNSIGPSEAHESYVERLLVLLSPVLQPTFIKKLRTLDKPIFVFVLFLITSSIAAGLILSGSWRVLVSNTQ